MANTFSFEAIRGIQARTAYYTIMVPLKMVPRLFLFDEGDLPADLRAQRVLSKARVPQIASYLSGNSGEYILSSLCASIDGDLIFEPASPDGPLRNVGLLSFPMDAKILLNDGQHRRAAIEEALRECPELESETISVVVFADRGLSRSQQMFADLNKNAVRPSGSLSVLYNHRDPLARLTSDVLSQVPFFGRFIEREKTSISNRTNKLYTLSSLNQAHEWLAGPAADRFGVETTQLTSLFWNAVYDRMPDWQRLDAGAISACELRHETVHAHGVMLQALGVVGAAAIEKDAVAIPEILKPLSEVDWSRRNLHLWEGRVLNGARIAGQRRAVLLGAAALFRTLGLPLDQRVVAAEESFDDTAMQQDAA
ncbi:DNA sulfur modification protein DndB [Sphingosinithalassobacter sp. LHW66-3]|uniref:DNA sulfur modification protein DndB n=1 Tax=Sphingosinithalassobacter sp. LHW66-3 TaxID=3424718 RepID=UPI003D6A8F3F